MTYEGDPALQRFAVALSVETNTASTAILGFSDGDAGSHLLAGSSAECALQIAADGVGPIAIYFDGEHLLVRSLEGEPRTRLNGRPLWSDWVMANDGDLLELGPARLLVRGGAAARRRRVDVELAERKSSCRRVRIIKPKEIVLLPERKRSQSRSGKVGVTALLVFAIAYVGWVLLLNRF